MSRSKQIGTLWETKIVEFLRESGWPHAERRALSGANDKGDIAGVIGLCVEAKSAAAIKLAEWIKETQVEKANAKARVGALWIKRRGKTSAGEGYVVMTGEQFVQLLKEAGY